MTTHLRIYCHLASSKEDDALPQECSEVSVQCSVKALLALASFFQSSAQRLESMDTEFAHVHFRDEWDEWREGHPDLIAVLAPRGKGANGTEQGLRGAADSCLEGSAIAPRRRTDIERMAPAVDMKNIQIIDGARNCVYDIFAATDEEFALIFPEGTDIAFIDDVDDRGNPQALAAAFSRIWRRPVAKSQAQGIHGTLFYQLEEKKAYYPTRRDAEAINPDGSRLR